MKASGSIALTGLTLMIATASPLLSVTHQSHPSMTVQEFSAGSQMDKKRTLGQLASHRQSLPVVELHELLNMALADDAPPVRESALMAIAGRLASSRGTLDLTKWRAEREMLTTFREKLFALLEDPDAHTRLAAVAAISSLEIERDATQKMTRSLRPETFRHLAARFDKETHGLTRAQIVNTIAWFTPQSSASAADSHVILEKALADSDPGVIQFALLGVERQHINALLPKVVALLAHERHAIRTTAAQTVAAFGAEARVYIPQLQAALGNETDFIAKKSLEGALRVIKR